MNQYYTVKLGVKDQAPLVVSVVAEHAMDAINAVMSQFHLGAEITRISARPTDALSSSVTPTAIIKERV